MNDFNQTITTFPGPKTAFGEYLVGQLSPIFQHSFEYTVDNTDLTTNSIVAGGTVTQADAMAVVTTSTTTGSSAKLLSKQHARYRAGLGGNTRFTALFTTGVANTEQLIGLADEAGSSQPFKNGYMIGFLGDTFGIHRFDNDDVNSETDFNVDLLDGTGPSGMTIDPTKLNVFEIRFQYLGGGAITFSIEDPNTGLFNIFHEIPFANLFTSPSVKNPNFFFTMWVDNKGTTDNLVLKSASFAYFIEGHSSLTELQQPQFSTTNIQKTGVTSDVAILTIRNKATYTSKTNFIDILMENVVGSIEAASANNLGAIRLVKNATLGGSPSYSDVNAADSVVEIDTSGTTVTGGKEFFTINLAGKNDRIFQNLDSYRFLLNPGETLTMAACSANSATIEGSLLWRELF